MASWRGRGRARLCVLDSRRRRPSCAWLRVCLPSLPVRRSVGPPGALCGPRRRRVASAVPRSQPFSRAPVTRSLAITLGPQLAPSLGRIVVLVYVVVVVFGTTIVLSSPFPLLLQSILSLPTSCRAQDATQCPVKSRLQPHLQSRRLCHLLCISSSINTKGCLQEQFLHPRPHLAHHTTPIDPPGLSTSLPDQRTPPRSL